MDYRDIIKSPIVTEKSSDLAKQNVITFSVDVKANKTEIKKAVENIFDVKVDTMNVKPKKKRVGRYAGKTNRVKKAIVKLKEGSSLEL